MVPNQQYGDLTVDEIPGLSLALASPGEELTLTVTRLDGAEITFDVTVPSLTSSLCLKAVGWSDRLAQKDAVDVWRLLRAHRERVVDPAPWRCDGVQGDAVAILRDHFARPNGAGVRAASPVPAERAEVRALTLAVLRGASC